MNIRVYDFDKTIYEGDSTVDFYKYCLKNNKSIIKYWPAQLWYFIIYVLGFIDKTKFKEHFYMFLKGLKDVDYLLKGFWDKNKIKIKKFYEKKDHSNDVIISASPEFLLTPICNKLKIKKLIASKVDKHTGKYDGANCYGEEKVIRLEREIPDYNIEEFYSDSLSDAPLANKSKNSFVVEDLQIIKWQDYKMSFINKIKNHFFSIEFIAFLVVGVINTINGVLFSWLFSSTMNANIAFIVGYVCSLTIAYLLNTFMIFKEKLGIKKYIKFCISYIPNFIIQNIVVIIMFNILDMNKLIAYIVAAIIGIPITFLCVKLFAFNDKSKKKDTKKIIDFLKNLSFILVLFIGLSFIIPTILFLFNVAISKITILLVIIFTITIYLFINIKFNKELTLKNNVLIIFIASAIIVICVFISGLILDTNNKTNEIYKPNIMLLEKGFNPLQDNAEEFNIKNNILPSENINYDNISNNVKLNYTYGAIIYSVTGNIETAKSIVLIMFIILILESLIFVYRNSRKFMRGIILAAIIAFSPIIYSGLLSFSIDTLVAEGFYTIILMLFSITVGKMKNDYREFIILFIYASICIGLTYVSFILTVVSILIFFPFLLTINRKNEHAKRDMLVLTIYFACLMFILLCFSGILFGKIESKKQVLPEESNIIGFENKNNFEKFLLSTFSYCSNKEAILKVPFMMKISENRAFDNLEVKISGHGRYFSALLVISLIILISYYIIFNKKEKFKIEKQVITVLLLIIVITSILIGDVWLAKLAPQIYLISLLSLYIIFMHKEYQDNIFKIILLGIYLYVFLINTNICFKPKVNEIINSNKYKEEIKEIKSNIKTNENSIVNVALSNANEVGLYSMFFDNNIKINITKKENINEKEYKKILGDKILVKLD